MKNIPIIDISPFLSGEDKEGVAEEIGRACEEIGFFAISGHGVSLESIEAAQAAAASFFDRSAEEKNGSAAEGGMGYIGPDGERLAASLDDKAVTDLKESLNLSLPISEPAWPTEPEAVRVACSAYYHSLLVLSTYLMRMFALALDLPEKWFDDKTDKPRTILRLLNYPAHDPAAQNLSRAGAHTDYGTLTILWSADSRGLQAKARNGEWVDVVASPEHFIINIGDLMMNWTNDKWISTLHKVVPHPERLGKRRMSMAFFHNPNADALIEVLEGCYDGDNPIKYAPILAKDHLEMKIAKSLGKEVKL
ncbi:MAG: 2-oxoglutarate and iron-dependent oxygenase domain-containing protein [Chloroflexota bacterium]